MQSCLCSLTSQSLAIMSAHIMITALCLSGEKPMIKWDVLITYLFQWALSPTIIFLVAMENLNFLSFFCFCLTILLVVAKGDKGICCSALKLPGKWNWSQLGCFFFLVKFNSYAFVMAPNEWSIWNKEGLEVQDKGGKWGGGCGGQTLPILDLICPAGEPWLWVMWAEWFLKESKQVETQFGRLNLVLFVLCAKWTCVGNRDIIHEEC